MGVMKKTTELLVSYNEKKGTHENQLDSNK